jgi:aspartate aminotransferase-like enzyme
MIYALNEALAIVLEEGLEARFERHKQMHLRLRAGLEAMGISYVPKHSLHTLNCIHIPDGVDSALTRRADSPARPRSLLIRWGSAVRRV